MRHPGPVVLVAPDEWGPRQQIVTALEQAGYAVQLHVRPGVRAGGCSLAVTTAAGSAPGLADLAAVLAARGLPAPVPASG